ncbi:IS607 family transposase [Fusobacterium pseudoperiodonticum]|uniref:IS607 family transposase n=1 Tax=Fusobacterium pseudoperiodonticum TaxID=2663009 RepID=UPI0028D67B61|nr:IS607 family transposase [Fusobacterium pseudoperiodonticum]
MEKEYIKASEYAKKMSLNVRTVYRYYHNGKIKGYQDKETCTIFILNPFKNKNNEDNLKNKVVLYARVSSSENKINLESQLEKLRLFASAKGYQIVKEIKDIGSGLNDNRSKLNELFEKELNNFEILLVEHKDRLTRFGFNYIDILLKSHNKKIEVINLVDNNKEDLIQDFVSVITSFCARIYSQRISKRKVEKLIKELGNESKENS